MHAGNINGNTAAGRVYRALLARRGEWVDGWTLTIDARVTAVGTRVSEVRAQLPAGMTVECEPRNKGYWYRLVSNAPGEQLELQEAV